MSRQARMPRWPKALRPNRWWGLIPLLPLLVVLWFAAAVWLSGSRTSDRNADAAVVLGAAVWTDRPSPVFRERIAHAVTLYEQRRVRKLLFTGGQAEGDKESEAQAAKDYALGRGVPEEDIILETSSTKTWENLQLAAPIAEQHGLRTFLIVSDPLHMYRAMRMARDLNLQAFPSPTPTTLYRSWSSKGNFLLREVYYNLAYTVRRLQRAR